MFSNQNILQKRFTKLHKHYIALKKYKNSIDELVGEKDIFDQWIYNTLDTKEQALLDAYLRRFSAMQDFLGSKIFKNVLELAGLESVKMDEILYNCERENIIDNIHIWIELRAIRNNLEHDYPEELQEALDGLKYCIEHFDNIEKYYLNSISFASKYMDGLDEIVRSN